MNNRIRYAYERISRAIDTVAEEMGVSTKEAYRFAFNNYTRARTPAGARTPAPTPASAPARGRDLNSCSILNTNQIDSTNGAHEPSSKASIDHFLDLGYVLCVAKKYMSEIPDWYVRWWHATQTANGWTTNQGKAITDKSWRPLLMTWWRNADEKERALIENEAKAARTAAQAPKVLTAADFAPCEAAHCIFFNDERMICSAGKTPCANAKKCIGFRASNS